ncbi:MAG: DedA family protein [Candidatus Zixiibacteriota bacterium]
MSEHLPQINAWLDHVFSHGTVWVYLAILVACMIENFVPPFPGDLFIVAAGGLVALARLDPVWSMVVACCGGMISAMTLYAVGRRFGRDYFIRKNYRFFSAHDIVRAQDKFDRWGGLILALSRFVVGLRVALIVGAGITAYPAIRMVIYTLISYLVFSGLLLFLGFQLVENLDRVEVFLTTYNYVVWVILVALVGWYVFRRAKKSRGRSKE